MPEILSPGRLSTRCSSCGCKFRFTPAEAWPRAQIVGMINSGTFERAWHVFTRCPTCQKRIDVTNKVPYEAVRGNDDSLCRCGPLSYHCEDNL